MILKQVRSSRIKASDLLLQDANDPETLDQPNTPDPTALGAAWLAPPPLRILIKVGSRYQSEKSRQA